jgi:hypothetical protein
MGKERAYMGHLDRRGLLPLVESAYREAWDGVFRLRSGRKIGVVWMVKGHVVHAIQLENGEQDEGLPALENVAAWKTGTYYQDAGALPPARTIRLEMEDIIAMLRRAAGESETKQTRLDHAGETRTDLNNVLQTLRKRVPGLESLSLSRGTELETTTAADAAEREWIYESIQQYCSDNTAVPEKLFLQQDDHLLLIVKNGRFAAVLSARGHTTPEALFWAGEEARKTVLDLTNDDNPKVDG